jgi:hypothetical protein
MFTLVDLGIFVAVGSLNIKSEKFDLVAFCLIQILSQNTNR